MASKKCVFVMLVSGVLSNCGGGGGGGGGDVTVDPKGRVENETIETLWVDHHQYWDPNDWPTPSLSLIVSSGNVPDFSLERMQTIPTISGFVYQSGYVYRIRVKKTKVIHLADVPVFSYSLLATEQKQSAAGQAFDFAFPKTQQYRRTGTSIKPLNMSLEYACDITVCESIDQLMVRPDVAEVVLQATIVSPEKPILFTAIKSVNATPTVP
ncbi:MAG: DUF4377 domain-containing protein [Moraxellaceae bacterium]|nr:MAG: DUF4377 domain-containing protein [Moraxellaceae bacterium]